MLGECDVLLVSCGAPEGLHRAHAPARVAVEGLTDEDDGGLTCAGHGKQGTNQLLSFSNLRG